MFERSGKNHAHDENHDFPEKWPKNTQQSNQEFQELSKFPPNHQNHYS